MERKKLISLYFTVIISVSLVLYTLGLIITLVLNANRLSIYAKENIGFSIILKNQNKEVDIIRLQKNLELSRYIKSTKFVSKDEAANDLKKELGEDFVDFMGYNPLLSSIDVKLKAEYANIDSIAVIEKELYKNQTIKELFFQKNLINYINENSKKISLIISIFSILLLIITIVLINNTIRLAMYSKRFIIKTMQLVGATQKFIIKPFVIKSIFHGSAASFLSILTLVVTLYFLQNSLDNILHFSDIGIVFFVILLIGMGISGVSTYYSVKMYLNTKSQIL